MKKILLFDFDNTLAYRDGMWTATLIDILEKAGYSHITFEQIEPYTHFGFPWQEYETGHKMFFGNLSWWQFMELMIADIFTSLDIQLESARQMAAQFREMYLDLTRWHLYEDTLSTLEQFQELGYTCHILSNHTPELSDIVRGVEIDHYFTSIFNSADIGYEKPHFRIFQHVIQTLDKSPDQLIMVGDNYIADVTGARSNGIYSVLVRKENKFNYKWYSKNLKDIFPVIRQIEYMKK